MHIEPPTSLFEAMFRLQKSLLRRNFRQAKVDLLRAQPCLDEGHLFDAVLYKTGRFRLS
jgi:hypothetical protein